MPEKTPWMTVSKPVSVWNKPIKEDFKSLFVALSKTFIHAATGQVEAVASDIVDVLTSVGIEKDPAQLAWLLISRSLRRAVTDLVKENAFLLKRNPPKDIDNLVRTLDLSLENDLVMIDRAFFEHPEALPFIESFKTPFKQWLMGHGLMEAKAGAVVSRLPTYFVYALNHEWRYRADVYKEITDKYETPFTGAGERQQRWALYYAWLQRQIEESIFGETFSLNQVYVPLRAYYSTANDDSMEPISSEEKPSGTVVNLEEAVDAWINQGDRYNAIKVISGGPGSGKSSFTKIYAAHLTKNETVRVLYIPLHLFDPKADLVEAIGNFATVDTRLLTHNPLDPALGERTVLIFDGLDELAMQGTVGSEVARSFIDEIQRTVNQFNLQELRLQVLITGREVIVQENRGNFRKPGQILHVLGYFVPKAEQDTLLDVQSLLKEDSRNLWWALYGTATGRSYSGVPDQLNSLDLDAITMQPLLNYLVAKSYEDGRLDFSKEINLNNIYYDMLKGVYERDYAGGPLPGIKHLSSGDFSLIMEEIGLATWQGNGRTATVSEIQRHCEEANLGQLLKDFREGAEKGVAQLLTAFYFRQHQGKRNGEQTFEFTHKTFGEYLTARRLIRAINRMNIQLKRRKTDLEDGLDIRGCLEHWVRVYGNAPAVNVDLHFFIVNEISLKEQSVVIEWQQMLIDAINWLLRYGMPMEAFPLRQSQRKENEAAIKAEEGLLAILSACSAYTKAISKIDWPDNLSAGNWINRFIGQRDGNNRRLAEYCLSYLNLQGCNFLMRDLYGVIMRQSDLTGAQLAYCLLMYANLEEANLSHATLLAANLEGVTMAAANLTQALISDVNLQGAILHDAKLENAVLQNARMTRINLAYADLNSANLMFSNLKAADLEGANLTGAVLSAVDLSGSNLRQANLSGAFLTKANLQGALLTDANVIGVIMDEETTLPDGSMWELGKTLEPFTV